MLDKLKKKDFENLEPGSLSLVHGEESMALSVVEARDLPSPSPREAPFAVELEGPATPLLQQAIYPVVHPLYGSLELFVVPIARTAAHARYEVIFN
jgi:hypothetical protein